MRKTKLIAAVAALTVICSATPSFAAESHSANTLVKYDFESGPSLSVTSSGTATSEVTKSPMDPVYSYPARTTQGDNTEPALTTNKAQIALAVAAGQNNNVLKSTTGYGANSNTTTVYEGKLPEDFVLDYSFLYSPGSYTDLAVTISQNGNTYTLMKKDGSRAYIGNDTTNTLHSYLYNNFWYEYSLQFSNFATDATTVCANYLSGLNSGKPVVDLGNVYENIDLSQDVKIDFTITKYGDMYLDNIRLYSLNQAVSNSVSKDFEADDISFAPRQNGIATGGFSARMVAATNPDNANDKANFDLRAYGIKVAADPTNASNKVLMLKRGDGSNEQTYDNGAKFTVNKPNKKLTISFKALIDYDSDVYNSGFTYSFAADVIDGTYTDVVRANNANTPADRIFEFLHSDNALISSGSRNGVKADDVWVNGWNDVTIEYNVYKNTTNITINGNTYTFTPKAGSEIISSIMASSEDTITVALHQPNPQSGSYLLLDNVSVVAENGDPDIEATDAQTLLYKRDDSYAGQFWNVTVPVLDNTNAVDAVFTDSTSAKSLARTIDISNFDGPGSGVFSVLLVGAPDTVTAAFTAAN